MSFSFNFAPDEDGIDEETDTITHNSGSKGAVLGKSDDDTTCKKDKITGAEAKEVTQFYDEELVSKFKTISMEFGQQRLKVVDTSKVGQMLLQDPSFAKSKDILGVLFSNSDLKAGVYEGGLKMWECGEDLTRFLSSHPVGQAIELEGKSVLELGCGAGLPGMYCCLCGAEAVHFQDFNEEVLQLLTHTNATYNMPETTAMQCRYFSGDWSSLSLLLKKEKQTYDVILTAETVYDPGNYASLHEVLCTALSNNGVIVVAAKVYYFGVGGSTAAFIEYVESQKRFTTEVVHTIQAGVSRQIILLRHQETNLFSS